MLALDGAHQLLFILLHLASVLFQARQTGCVSGLLFQLQTSITSDINTDSHSLTVTITAAEEQGGDPLTPQLRPTYQLVVILFSSLYCLLLRSLLHSARQASQLLATHPSGRGRGGRPPVQQHEVKLSSTAASVTTVNILASRQFSQRSGFLTLCALSGQLGLLNLQHLSIMLSHRLAGLLVLLHLSLIKLHDAVE